jgi:hypothetical protein
MVRLGCVEVPLQALFNNDHAVVKADTVDGAMRARHRLRLIMKIGVNVVDDLLGDFNECLAPAISAVKCRRIGGVKVFANVNATLIQERKRTWKLVN